MPPRRRCALSFFAGLRIGRHVRGRLTGCPDGPPSTPSRRRESHVQPSRDCLPQHRPAIPGRTRSRRRSSRSRGQSGSGPSFNTCLSQNAVAQPTGVLLRMDRDPHFLAGRGVFQQHVASLPGTYLDESGGLQFADDFSSSHMVIMKPNVRLSQERWRHPSCHWMFGTGRQSAHRGARDSQPAACSDPAALQV